MRRSKLALSALWLFCLYALGQCALAEGGSPSISGLVFNDANGNGIKDSSEMAITGWTVNVITPDRELISAKTGQDGTYAFSNLSSGSYIASDELQQSWKQTSPASGYYAISLADRDVKSVNFGSVFIGAKNHPPATPSTLAGQSRGIPRASYNYSVNSTDPDASDMVRYTLSWGDNYTNTTGLMASGADATLAHAWQRIGIYPVIAMATDSRDLSSNWSAPLVVTIDTTPSIPTKPSGQIIAVLGTAYSYSTSSTDPDDGDTVKYELDWGDGQNSTSGSNSPGATVSMAHAWSAAGPRSIRAKAIDSLEISSEWSQALDITVDTPPSTPSTPSGAAAGIVGTQYSYSTSSTDPDSGDTIKYTFAWGDGQTSTTGFNSSGVATAISHSWQNPGYYNVTAFATDSRGIASAASAAMIVNITGIPNHAPSTPSKPTGAASGVVGTKYTYTTSSTDQDSGDTIKYTFAWGDGQTSTTGFNSSGITAGISHIWSSAGTFNVTATAIDNRGATSAASQATSVAITIVPPNLPPVTPGAPTAPDSLFVELNGTITATTIDPESDQIRYTFDWGDGTTTVTGLMSSGSTATVYHIWPATATYQVRVTATDSKGASSPQSPAKSVSVTAPVAVTVTPTLISPKNTATTSNPTFKWNPVPCSTSYNLRISDAGGEEIFSRIYTPQETVSRTIRSATPPVNLDPASTYTWRIQAYNSINPAGKTSDSATFTVP